MEFNCHQPGKWYFPSKLNCVPLLHRKGGTAIYYFTLSSHKIRLNHVFNTINSAHESCSVDTDAVMHVLIKILVWRKISTDILCGYSRLQLYHKVSPMLYPYCITGAHCTPFQPQLEPGGVLLRNVVLQKSKLNHIHIHENHTFATTYYVRILFSEWQRITCPRLPWIKTK